MTTSAPRKRKIILHVGFNKTGSSSIQESFSKLKMDGIEYAKWGESPNHSGVVKYAFAQDKSNIYGAGATVGGLAALQERAGKLRVKLADAISESAAPVLMFSAEALCNVDHIDAVTSFKAFLAPFASEFQVIGYVRPHADLFASAFQQKLKMGTSDSLLSPKYPGEGVQMLQKLFGKEAVTIVPFDRSSLVGGDVVLDFAHRIGVTITPAEVVRANESLSQEAIAVLACHFAHARHRMDYPGALVVQRRLQEVLARFGSTRFRFSAPLIKANLDGVAQDVAWVKDNLGIVSVVPEGEGGIGSREELLQIGAAQLDRLTAFVALETGSGPVGQAQPANVASVFGRLKDTPRRMGLVATDKAMAAPEQGAIRTAEQRVADLVDQLKDALRRSVEAERQVRGADRVAARLIPEIGQSRPAGAGEAVAQPGSGR